MQSHSDRQIVPEWSFPERILDITHRWYWIVLFCLVGSLLGWGISMIWPSPHRATKELYVGINVYRAGEDKNAEQHAGLEFLNANDYKNWQMANLNSLVLMDDVIDQTLEQLRFQDDYWKDIHQKELAGMLHVYWRNAGKWRLVAENDDPYRARQAVTTWEEVVIQHVHSALEEARQAMALDYQVHLLTDVQTQVADQGIALGLAYDALNSWSTRLESYNASQPLKQAEQAQLRLVISQIPQKATREVLLGTLPSPGAAAQEYRTWMTLSLPTLEHEFLLNQERAEALQISLEELLSQYGEVSQKSLGLSTDLVIDKITDAQPAITVVRPTSMMVLTGAFIGLTLWAIFWLVRINLERRSRL